MCVSHKATEWAIEQTPKTALEKMVLMVLADRHNGKSDRCFPSISDISERAICSRRGAINAIESLISQGLIRAEKAPGKKTFYTFSWCTEVTGAESALVHSVHLTGALSSKTGALSAPESGRNQELTNKSVRTREKPRSRFCPDDWSPNPAKLRTVRIPRGVDVDHELAKFRTYEFKTPRSDWDRAFANWLASAEPRKNDGRNQLERQTDELLGTNRQGQSGLGSDFATVATHTDRHTRPDPRLVTGHRWLTDGGD